jgi:hypothetical protein
MANSKKEPTYLTVPLRPYHANSTKRKILNKKGSMMGFEMEVYPVTNYRGNSPVIEKLSVLRSRTFSFDAEQDGSLSLGGFEIITRKPIRDSQLRNGWVEKVCKHLTNTVGIKAGKQGPNAGLHINVNIAYWTPWKLKAFLAVLQLDVEGFRSVAERDPGRDPAYRATFPQVRSNRVGGIRPCVPCVEIRGMHMSLDPKSFQAKIDWVKKCEDLAESQTQILCGYSDFYAKGLVHSISVSALENGEQRQLPLTDLYKSKAEAEFVNARIGLRLNAQKEIIR